MKLIFIIAAVVLLALLIGCTSPEAGTVAQQAAVDAVPEAEVKDGCSYGNPPCGENYSCLDNSCILKPGCTYSNPPCNASYDCANNTCVLKGGCGYNNPGCDSNHSCLENTCVLKEGCRYGNPSCNSSQICQNNKCFEHILGGDGGGY